MIKTNEPIEIFFELYGSQSINPGVYFSPGRVNLIGEHTDYNGGYVFPCALDFGTYLIIRKNGTNKLRFATTNFDDRGTVLLSTPVKKQDKRWFNYPLGVIDQFQNPCW